MKRCSGLLVVSVLALSFFFSLSRAVAQVDHIVIAAGTDEDHALQAITNEQDPQKKLAMYEDFVQKFSANPAAVAYGNWQISQAYQGSGDVQKALDYGDKALAGSPHNLGYSGFAGESGAAGQKQRQADGLFRAWRPGLPIHRQAA